MSTKADCAEMPRSVEEVYIKEEHFDSEYEDISERQSEVETRKYEISGCPQHNQQSFIDETMKGIEVPYLVKTDTHSVLCNFCNKEFNYDYFIKNHIDSHNMLERCCVMCETNFDNCIVLNDHVKNASQNTNGHTHEHGDSVQCSVCREKFDEFPQFKNHFEKHKEIKKYKCHICSVKLLREIDAVAHLKSHMKSDKRVDYLCVTCMKFFDTDLCLLEHNLKFHNFVKFDNSIIEIEKFDSEEAVTSHKYSNVYNDPSHSSIENIKEKSSQFVMSTKMSMKNEGRGLNDGVSKENEFSDSEELNEDLNFDDGEDYKQDLCHKADSPKEEKIRSIAAIKTKLKGISRKSNSALNKKLECKVCSQVLQNKAQYKTHMKTHSIPKQMYVCEICNLQFEGKSLYTKHLKSHTQKRINTFECVPCKKKFNTKKDFNVHTLTHPNSRPFECLICGKRFPRSYELKIHFMTHTGENPFECSVCTKKFKKNYELKIHMMTHGGAKPHSCAVCGKTFTKNCYLKDHMSSHMTETPFQCTQCTMKFKSQNNLRKHIITHSGAKPFQCKICNSRFTKKGSLKAHIYIHTGEKPFQCIVCEKSFNSKSTLRNHMKFHRGAPVGEQVYFECDYCNKMFNRKANLSDHIRLHTGEKPHKCFICNRAFTLKSTLNKHMRIHGSTLYKSIKIL